MTASEPELFPVELPPRLRLERISITGIKAIDQLELSFPPPDLPGDPDVFVLGSRNGVGKTSALEACALFLATPPDHEDGTRRFVRSLTELSNRSSGGTLRQAKALLGRLVRAGCEQASVTATLSVGPNAWTREIGLSTNGRVTDVSPIEGPESIERRFEGMKESLNHLQNLVGGSSSDPLVGGIFLYFHSYRRVQDGSESLSSLAGRRGPRADLNAQKSPISVFKQELLRALMGRAALFEQIGGDDGRTVLEKLNGLVARYARGKIDKLLPQADETFDFRVQPLAGGPTYSFDSLSSGQKEVISTLFLIWLFTRDQPAVVLIDEPELHLNPEWHRTFVRDLAGIAPNNQYILATHSEEIFASVDPAHRALLEPDGGAQ